MNKISPREDSVYHYNKQEWCWKEEAEAYFEAFSDER
jgi:hypothetical protein